MLQEREITDYPLLQIQMQKSFLKVVKSNITIYKKDKATKLIEVHSKNVSLGKYSKINQKN